MMTRIPNLADNLMKRTSVKISDKKELIREQIPECETIIETIKPERNRFAAFCNSKLCSGENPKIVPHPGFPDDPNQTIYFWEVTNSIDKPIISTVSKDGSWGMTTRSDSAPNVWTNPRLHVTSLGDRIICDRIINKKRRKIIVLILKKRHYTKSFRTKSF